ncbi:BRO family protein [Bradyrhizobium sp. ERR14]|uniref:BRO-N domain-containing protein n=1 Tax=Bradyrhizobium sp. ERR14 TaxID=2663837 RepID=UPI001621BFCB|nr:BRO family protein [Bradyrhizobium sp. ERR14]MBB4395179.1 prophage antirepressor-like protein [Bradyrhizobium sp. ERR14]
MQYSLQIFERQDHSKFRTFSIDGEIWFNLSDVCDAIGLMPHKRSYAEHAAKLEDDEKRKVTQDFANGMPGSDPGFYNGPRPATLISESGMYTLVLRSDKPAAKVFRRWVTAEVLPSIRKTGRYGGETPAFIRRYNDNWDRVSTGYFSVINELAVRLWGRLEMVGHIMADRAPDGKEIRPDVSVGRLFSDWLKKKHPSVSSDYAFYVHKTPEWEGEARQYSLALLPLYIEFIDTVWIPDHSERYLRTRDVAALPYLPKLLPTPGSARPVASRVSIAGRQPASMSKAS